MNMVYFACIYPQELPNFVGNYSNWDPTLTNMHHFVIMMYYEYVYNITILQWFSDPETTVNLQLECNFVGFAVVASRFTSSKGESEISGSRCSFNSWATVEIYIYIYI